MTTSTEAAEILRNHLLSALLDGLGPVVVADVQVLAPTDRLTELGAHAALVVHLTTGERFGMEVCPFPRPPVFPAANLRVAQVRMLQREDEQEDWDQPLATPGE